VMQTRARVAPAMTTDLTKWRFSASVMHRRGLEIEEEPHP
jgi:hypothetical protein